MSKRFRQLKRTLRQGRVERGAVLEMFEKSIPPQLIYAAAKLNIDFSNPIQFLPAMLGTDPKRARAVHEAAREYLCQLSEDLQSALHIEQFWFDTCVLAVVMEIDREQRESGDGPFLDQHLRRYLPGWLTKISKLPIPREVPGALETEARKRLPFMLQFIREQPDRFDLAGWQRDHVARYSQQPSRP